MERYNTLKGTPLLCGQRQDCSVERDNNHNMYAVALFLSGMKYVLHGIVEKDNNYYTCEVEVLLHYLCIETITSICAGAKNSCNIFEKGQYIHCLWRGIITAICKVRVKYYTIVEKDSN